MYAKRQIETIREMKCRLHNIPSNIVVLTKLINPSFFVEWNKDSGQFKIVQKEK